MYLDLSGWSIHNNSIISFNARPSYLYRKYPYVITLKLKDEFNNKDYNYFKIKYIDEKCFNEDLSKIINRNYSSKK